MNVHESCAALDLGNFIFESPLLHLEADELAPLLQWLADRRQQGTLAAIGVPGGFTSISQADISYIVEKLRWHMEK